MASVYSGKKPVMLIGLASRPDQVVIVVNSLLSKYYAVAKAVAEGYVDHYDMSSLPGKGDALLSLNKVGVVVGFHLYFDSHEPRSAYFYNNDNNELIPMAFGYGLSVFLFGDQPCWPPPPSDQGVNWKLYSP